MKRMVIKPTANCTANCCGCVSRRQLHRSFTRDTWLSTDQWISVIDQAADIGVEDLHISGGEPTLFSDLVGLIQHAKQRGLRVRINTNGSLVDREYAGRLLDAGLDEVCISIYSAQPEVHNTIRGSKNLWQKATEAVRIFAELRADHPGFLLGTMTIILRENFRSMDRLLQLHHELGSQQMGFSYLEGDFSADYLMTEAEIREFRESVIPRMLRYGENLDSAIRNRARNTIESLYSGALGTDSELARGTFWKARGCSVPSTAGLVMANGDVHPCNIVEYVHEPVVGNVHEQRLGDIWQSDAWAAFRRDGHPLCARCPVNRYAAVPLREDGADSGVLVSLFHSKAFSPFRPLAQRAYDVFQRVKTR